MSGLKHRLPRNASAKTVVAAADDLEKKLVAVREDLINLTISANEDSLAYPPQLDAKLAYLAMDVGVPQTLPQPKPSRRGFEKLKRQSGELVGALGKIMQAPRLAAFQKSRRRPATVVVPAPAIDRGRRVCALNGIVWNPGKRSETKGFAGG